MRAILLLALLAPSVLAQESFSDADYEFSMQIPPGMALTTAEEMAAVTGQPVESFQIVSRADSETGKVVHQYHWRDATGRGRDIDLKLIDDNFPFGSPDQFEQAIREQAGVDVDTRISLGEPEYNQPGSRMEGTRTNSMGLLLRQMDAVFPIKFDPPRYALIRMHCLEGDWKLFVDEFEAVLKSVKSAAPKPPSGAGGGPQGRRKGKAEQGSEERWDTLEVTGSLALAAMLLMTLFVGGRSSSGS
jgi:hypothetical protein